MSIEWGSVDFLALNHLGLADLLLRLAAATLLGAIIGFERERLERAAGLKTHALVCVASALIMVVSTYGFPQGEVFDLDPSRIAAQVVSGVGFLGAGVIIFRKNTVRGLTTAASVWAVAGVGLAAGSGLYVPATAGTLFILLVQAGMRPVEAYFFPREDERQRMLIETRNVSTVLAQIPVIAAHRQMRVQSMQFERDATHETALIELAVRFQRRDDRFAVVDDLHQIDGVVRVNDRFGVATLRRTGRRGISFPEEDVVEEDVVDDEEEELE